MPSELSGEDYERLLHGVATEAIADDGDVSIEPPVQGFQARIRLISRTAPDRVATMNMHAEWLEALFSIDPIVGIFTADDFAEEKYTTERVRELVAVVHAYLRGEGSIEWRRTLLGRRRPQLRISAVGREWVAR